MSDKTQDPKDTETQDPKDERSPQEVALSLRGKAITATQVYRKAKRSGDKAETAKAFAALREAEDAARKAEAELQTAG